MIRKDIELTIILAIPCRSYDLSIKTTASNGIIETFKKGSYLDLISKSNSRNSSSFTAFHWMWYPHIFCQNTKLTVNALRYISVFISDQSKVITCAKYGTSLYLKYRVSVVLISVLTQIILFQSRVVQLNKNERNYHVFYQLLAGCSKEKESKLTTADNNTVTCH